ncbi:competence protein CoiA [Bacillus salitolerans]|uniref:Competence protein CoiA n=1 Tax=Bacillus salitolerans TaxID=1437434 RepID=A0ABW4LJD0_9BACI
MLVALMDNGEMISLGREYSKKELEGLRMAHAFFCPSCREKVHLKLGEVRIPHFAHQLNANCDAFSDQESMYHLNGKLQLFQWLKKQQYQPILEPYFQELKQRPDICFEEQSTKNVIEYQCSSISASLFKTRSHGYIKHGICPLWILGGKRIKRLSKDIYKLSLMDWLAASFIHNSPAIMYYCSDTKQFVILQNIIPLSTNRIFASTKTFPLSQTSIKNLVSPQPNNLEAFLPCWIQMKQKWRVTCTQYPSTSMKKLLSLYYSKNVYPSLLPPEIGIPLPSMYWIHTSPMVWQSWILLDFILSFPLHQTFSLQNVYNYFNKKIKMSLFSVRELPLVHQTDYTFAIKEYIHQLCSIGTLQRVGQHHYHRVQCMVYPSSLEEAFHRDRLLLHFLTRKVNA